MSKYLYHPSNIPECPKLTVDAPPCVKCKHWEPQATYMHTDIGYQVDGIRLCHAEQMFPDFSCFQPKPL